MDRSTLPVLKRIPPWGYGPISPRGIWGDLGHRHTDWADLLFSSLFSGLLLWIPPWGVYLLFSSLGIGPKAPYPLPIPRYNRVGGIGVLKNPHNPTLFLEGRGWGYGPVFPLRGEYGAMGLPSMKLQGLTSLFVVPSLTLLTLYYLLPCNTLFLVLLLVTRTGLKMLLRLIVALVDMFCIIHIDPR